MVSAHSRLNSPNRTYDVVLLFFCFFFWFLVFFLLERGMITGFGGCGMCDTCNSLRMCTRLNNVY